MKKEILFIINPISGHKRGVHLVEKIEALVDRSQYDFSIVFTEYRGHAAELARRAVARKLYMVVAAGGDGTINEVATQLVGSETALAIIPVGSGNGLARHLHIPLEVKKVIHLINAGDHIEPVDACRINNDYFFSVAGIGYDAKVAFDFNRGHERGFAAYFHYIIRNYFSYKSTTYQLKLDGKEVVRKAFFITFANSSQWGYNVKINPKASVQDGEFEVCICKKPNWLLLLYLATKLLLGKIDTTKLIEYQHVKEIEIVAKKNEPFYLHIDGDSVNPVQTLKIKILPASLRCLIGS